LIAKSKYAICDTAKLLMCDVVDMKVFIFLSSISLAFRDSLFDLITILGKNKP